MSETKARTILEKISAQRARDVELAKSTPGTTPEDMRVYLDDLNIAPTLISFVDRLKRNPGAHQLPPKISFG
jgi:anthranilate synthase/indole-3-glycerol phosphate synthase/phosphoribosylanthranilate isomerase